MRLGGGGVSRLPHRTSLKLSVPPSLGKVRSRAGGGGDGLVGAGWEERAPVRELIGGKSVPLLQKAHWERAAPIRRREGWARS